MKPRPDIARFDDAQLSVAHCWLPPWESGEYVSVSNPASIAVSFTHQRKAVVQLPSSRRVERTVTAGSFGCVGMESISWLRVREPSECLEVTGSPQLRKSVAAELSVERHADLDEINGSFDPVIWTLIAHIRSVVRRRGADALLIETLVRQLYEYVLVERFGGRVSGRGDGRLGRPRLLQLCDWIEAHLDDDITISRLADAASLSPAHFIRSFKRSMGLPPHQYVRARRLERARAALARNASVSEAARAGGFLSVSQFREAFLRHFGHPAQATPRRPRNTRQVRR
jgi:AraC family transcriptional regulator